ncbi:hypothetical protein B0T22DRAFT_203344 [Podospora appendiculata]|uniref:Microsomal glutathione S-transferase 3 n=1 Tax=Podospora appendiculata TaxID=314037 RepID=A0AAE0X4B4_9PEZI|nr:hypothetical protein B0T22DRAFT_203344 [Podospora appendiculata]
MAITLPQEYGYVLLAVASTFFVNTFHAGLTSKYRKASGIKYPVAYASNEVAEKDPKAFAFNCAQRAHANFTENLTPAIGATLIAGLRYPVAAAALGVAWSVSRVVYAIGYAASGPKGRSTGSLFGALVDFSLKLTATYAAVKFILEQ